MRGRLEPDPTYGFAISIAPNQDSSLLRPFLTANCLVRREPHAPAIGEGENSLRSPVV